MGILHLKFHVACEKLAVLRGATEMYFMCLLQRSAFNVQPEV